MSMFNGCLQDIMDRANLSQEHERRAIVHACMERDMVTSDETAAVCENIYDGDIGMGCTGRK